MKLTAKGLVDCDGRKLEFDAMKFFNAISRFTECAFHDTFTHQGRGEENKLFLMLAYCANFTRRPHQVRLKYTSLKVNIILLAVRD